MLAIQSSVPTAPSATVKMGVRGAGRFRAYPTSLNSRASMIRRMHFLPRASDDEAVTPSEAPGEGKRVRPGAVDKDGYSEGERLEPWKGPQVSSKGVAPDEAEPVSDAFKDARAEEFPAADAPGEGKRRPPAPAEFADTGGKPKVIVHPRVDPVSADE